MTDAISHDDLYKLYTQFFYSTFSRDLPGDIAHLATGDERAAALIGTLDGAAAFKAPESTGLREVRSQTQFIEDLYRLTHQYLPHTGPVQECVNQKWEDNFHGWMKFELTAQETAVFFDDPLFQRLNQCLPEDLKEHVDPEMRKRYFGYICGRVFFIKEGHGRNS